MVNIENVGKNIAYLRRQRGLTQMGLAAAMNVSHQAVSKWENGVALPDMQTLLSLSHLFGVSLEELLTGSMLETEAEAPAAQPIELKLDNVQDDILTRAEAVLDDVESVIGTNEDESPESPEEYEPAAKQTEKPESAAADTPGMEEILRMAAFVGRDALEVMLAACERKPTLAELAKLAPFLRRETLASYLADEEAMDWDALRRLAPFMDSASLKRAVLAHASVLDLEDLRRLAPFLNRDALTEALDAMPENVDFAALKKLAPFLNRDALARLLNKHVGELDVDTLIGFAPYLNRTALGDLLDQLGQPVNAAQMLRLARFLPKAQLDGLVYRLMGVEQKTAEEWNKGLNNTFTEIGSTLRSAVEGAMREAKNVFSEVVEGVNSTIDEVVAQPVPKPTPAQERAARIRNRIAEKALSDGNWDWLENHIEEISGDMLKQVLLACMDAGHPDLLDDNIGRVELTVEEACDLALKTTDSDLWAILLEKMDEEHIQRVVEHIRETAPDEIERFAAYLGEDIHEHLMNVLREGGDISDLLEKLDAPAKLQLAKAAVLEGIEALDDVLEALEDEMLPEVLKTALEADRTELVSVLAESADEEIISEMAAILAECGSWDLLAAVLEDADDVDLTKVIEKLPADQQLVETVAQHASEETLNALALTLAAQGEFHMLDSFLEELDPDTLEMLLEKAMAASDWSAIEKIDEALNG